MYRRLKNILGVSLMVLAVVISQIPMPEAQAEIIKEMTAADMQVDDASAHVVTFSMNGGTFRGNYNGYSFQEKTPVLIIDDGKTINSFPDDSHAAYSGYKTEAGTWYTDPECLTEFDAGSSVTRSLTLYKKWYNITSDGSTLAAKGVHISADGTVLYQYDGDETLVEIPATVTTIADGAFDDLSPEVRGIVLPAGIQTVEDNAFQGIADSGIVYIYDSDTAASKAYGKQLAARYEQLVYSDYLDPEKTEEIVGISYVGADAEEAGATPEGGSQSGDGDHAGSTENTDKPSDKNDQTTENTDKPSESGDGTEGDSNLKPTESESEENESDTESTEDESDTESTEDESDTESTEDESDTESTEDEESEEEESSSSSVIEIEPEERYTVTFDTGISGVDGEKREVVEGKTVSELVSVNGDEPRILRKDSYEIKQDDGKQEIVHTFKGWYKDNACTEEWDFSEDVIEKDTTIYAKWDKQTRAYFHVTYSATQGNEKADNIPGRQKLYEDQKLEKPSATPSIANKTFKGWYTSASGGSEYTSWGKPVTADMTLYAHFEGKTNSVVFHMNGGGFTGSYNGSSYTDAASLTAKVTTGQKISTAVYPENGNGTSSAFKYSNYTTDGNWYKDKECLEAYKNDAALNSDITLYKKWYYTSSGFTMSSTSSTLYKYSGGAEDVIIPDSVTVIGSDAFASVAGISSITLPDNIAEVKDNAFSGVNKVSKDIVITGKTEKAQSMAKKLAEQYTRLVYEGSEISDGDKDSSVVVAKAASGSIKLGATLSGNVRPTGNNTAAAPSGTSKTGTITLGAGSVGTTGTAGTQTTVVSQPSAGSQNAAASQNTVPAQQQGTSGSSVQTSQGARTTQRQNTTSASAPKSTQHIKDSTPKTGDPLQYRMLIVCAMFSVGVLLVLTGNGKKKRLSAS